MRKEKLLAVKRGKADKLPWYAKLTDAEIATFSPRQIDALQDILARAEKYREGCAVWYGLDVHRAIRKPTGGEPEIIVEIDYANNNAVRQVDRDYINQTAAASILRAYDAVR